MNIGLSIVVSCLKGDLRFRKQMGGEKTRQLLPAINPLASLDLDL